jgi:thymidylate kinase
MGETMIIELAGTPGAGKTTLLPVAREHFMSLGFHANTIVDAARPFAKRTLEGKLVSALAPDSLRGPLLWQVFYRLSQLYRFRFSLKNGDLVRAVQKHQKNRPISDVEKRYVIYWFVHLTGYYEFLKAHAHSDDILIVDEGFIHRVIQLFASEAETPDIESVEAYLDLIPRPDLAIFPLAPLATCKRRIYARGIWERFREKSPEDVDRFLANSKTIIDFTREHIQKKGWAVIEVNNGAEDPAIAKSTLRHELSQLTIYSTGAVQLTPGL